MTVVIPIGAGRPPSLPYVLRALAANTTVDHVVTVGAEPKGVNPDMHIANPNSNRTRYLNVLAHLCKALEVIDAPFVWTADDIFPMRPWTPGVYVRKESIAAHLRRYQHLGNYAAACRASVKIIEGLGYKPDEVPCGAIHRPWLVDPDRARLTVDRVRARGAGEWKMVYVAGLDGVITAGDPKVVGFGVPQSNADMISTDHQSWKRNAGRAVRERFTEPSRWETL